MRPFRRQIAGIIRTSFYGANAMQYRERPNCRKIIEGMLKEKGCTLEALIDGDAQYRISEAMRIQVRKMIQERK